jgi:hypothetical protein
MTASHDTKPYYLRSSLALPQRYDFMPCIAFHAFESALDMRGTRDSLLTIHNSHSPKKMLDQRSLHVGIRFSSPLGTASNRYLFLAIPCQSLNSLISTFRTDFGELKRQITKFKRRPQSVFDAKTDTHVHMDVSYDPSKISRLQCIISPTAVSLANYFLLYIGSLSVSLPSQFVPSICTEYEGCGVCGKQVKSNFHCPPSISPSL